MYRRFALFSFFLVFLTSFTVQGSLDDRRLHAILNELVSLRAELGEIFRVPTKQYAHHEEEWVVHVEGGPAEARWLADLTGTQYVGPMRGFSNLYVFKSPLNQTETHRIKRDLSRHSGSQTLWSELQQPYQRQKRDVLVAAPFNDPLYSDQWEVNGLSQVGSMRVLETWAANYTGRGVVVSILDDGIDYTHVDLARNYDPKASYDLNDDDEDPMPTMDEYNKHGTRCAGEVAMLANNSKCGVGLAFNSKIGGVRMLDGKVNDRLEAEALSFLIDHVDVLSSSWGPADDGRTVEGPGRLAAMAMEKGIREGRKGKGSIYVWASGNGGIFDDCSCDGYTSSIYTFTVSGVSSAGQFPWYGEPCASTLTTTFSSGNSEQKKIVTIDPQNQCTTEHTGTSAAAPLAAGIIALALEANPSLTWREVQHLAAWTSNPTPLFHVPGWRKNGAGLWSSPKFGFGLMDAYEMTRLAKDFAPIDSQQVCTTTFPGFRSRTVTGEMGVAISFKLNGCEGSANEIRSLEHVRVVADISSEFRGLLSIVLESPSGMTSQLLHPRLRDNTTDASFKEWPFTSVQFWGENPIGIWKLHIDHSTSNLKTTGLKSVIKNLTIVLYGTKEKPKHAQKPRVYQDLTNSSPPDPLFSADEEAFDITNIERTINEARLALEKNQTIAKEKHMEAVDRIVRTIHEMDLHRTRKRRRPAFISHAWEK